MDGIEVSDRLWRLTLEHSPVGMTIVSPEGRFLAVNQALCRMLDRPSEVLLTLTFQEITHPDDLALDLELLATLLADKVPSYRMVKRFLRPDGEVVWGDLSVALVHDDDGSPLHLVSQVMDVTQQHDDRARLAETEARLDRQLRRAEAIFDSVDVGLVLIDADGRYESMNRHHEALMRVGYPDGHAGQAGQPGQVFGEDGRTPLTREDMPTWRAARGEEFDDLRIWIGVTAEERRALSVSARSVRDANGLFHGAALVYKDVTDYLRAMSVRDEFLSAVSHELRTPLTSVLGHLEIANELPDLPAAVAHRLAVIERNALRLDALVADLLEVARQREGRLSVTRTDVDLTDLVAQAVEAVRPAASLAGLSVVIEPQESLQAPVDPGRIRQVLDNLLSNAVKYSEPGGVVRIAVSPVDDEAILTIADEGLGIEEAELDRLFTRFFRGGEARSRQIPGTGLGLVLVRAFVEAHGGTVDLTSKAGVGTTVTVRLPL
ncbi:ATP-binding protein [uncultured Nocardioides sp.]|uniref:PAS domain-containing sensor histidine kinase n=1 Tax=uncultured Nocardioides sp. TaxID=198441 RepID=UPI0026071302|nr:ATP-binding protein [uncultured Nocardioides sp.]